MSKQQVFLLHFYEAKFGKSENVDIAEPNRIAGGRHGAHVYHIGAETSRAYPKAKSFQYSDVRYCESRHRTSISTVDFGTDLAIQPALSDIQANMTGNVFT